MKFTPKIDAIIERSKRLVEQNQEILSKNDALTADVKLLKQMLDAESKKNEELLNKIKIIKLAQNMGAPGTENPDVKELKRKINEYIKEIDHCITMLND
ncbi:MAG TPA: hypothetical protein VK154_13110 [Chitinophagales bacterium]|nr:hypothetical protein [Chitinophagales bacterium]